MVKGDDLNPFFQSVLKLKSVKRAGWTSKVNVKSPESVADHTFSMCAIAMLLGDMIGLDTKRILKMVILHDLAESVTGDYVPGDIAAREKIVREKKAMSAILSCLPAGTRTEYEDIWLEYLQHKTSIARFVHRLDKLELALQADHYASQGYSEELLGPFFESAKAAIGNEGDIVNKVLEGLRNGKKN
jgi:putative hydrolase of HD superfamily